MATTSTTLAGRPAFLQKGRQAAESLRRAPLIPLAIILIVVFTGNLRASANAPFHYSALAGRPAYASGVAGGRHLGTSPLGRMR